MKRFFPTIDVPGVRVHVTAQEANSSSLMWRTIRAEEHLSKAMLF